jgi:hypothetical protein
MENSNVSMNRSQYIFDKLVEKDIEPGRLVVKDGGIKGFEIILGKFVSYGEIIIIGIDYVPLNKVK